MLAALLPIAAAPILGRLYLPSDYGALATFMTLSSLFGAVSTLQLPLGIIAERSERRAVLLVAASIIVASGFAVVAGLVGLAFFFGMGVSASYGDVRGWMLMLPATVLSGGITTGIAALANRRAAYGALARIPILAAIVTVGTSVLFGVLGWGVDGLFLSYFLGQAIGLATHLQLAGSLGIRSATWHPRRLLAVGWRHRDYAWYTMPSQFLSVVSLSMPVYALSAIGNVGLLGAYHRANALVSMPLTLIGGAVAQVFRQRASEDYRRTGSCRPIYMRTALGLLAAGLPTLGILMLYAPDLFRLVLGPNWGEAGEIARILAPMLLLRLLCSPLSAVFFFTGGQRRALQLTVVGALVTVAGVGGALLVFGTAQASIVAFASVYSVIYISFIAGSWRLATTL